MKNQTKILFFDGVCNLCNGSVDFLIRHRQKSIYKFASLQGSTAQKELPPNFVSDLNTVVYFKNGQIHTKSSAALHVIADSFHWGPIVLLLFIFPKFIRDFIYNLIAKNRFRLFGKKESCRIPTPEEKLYFLD